MTADDTTGGDADARAAALEMLKAGEADVSDVARLAGVDRQLVHYWAKVERIDVADRRDAVLSRQWRGHMARLKGGAKPKRMTKAEMRADADKAVAAFNRKRQRPKQARA